MVALVPILLAVLALLAVGMMGGCAGSQASDLRQRLNEIDWEIKATEAKRAEIEAERSRGAEIAKGIIEGLPAIDALEPVLGPIATQELRTEALARAEAIRAGLAELDVAIQEQNNLLGKLKGWENETRAAIEQREERIDAGLNIADVLIGVGASFIPGLGALKIGTSIARRRGKQQGAEAVAISIDTLRAMSPEIDQWFDKLTPKQKAAAHEALKTIPEWEKVLGVSRVNTSWQPVTP